MRQGLTRFFSPRACRLCSFLMFTQLAAAFPSLPVLAYPCRMSSSSPNVWRSFKHMLKSQRQGGDLYLFQRKQHFNTNPTLVVTTQCMEEAQYNATHCRL
jgi:hypothetical protein